MVPHFDEICEKKKSMRELVGKKKKRTIPFTYLFFLIFYDSDHDENDNEGMNSLVIIVYQHKTQD